MNETLDRLAGDWSVFQLRDGHRFSTDDQVCAWHATREMPDALDALDLGSGIGSVGLLVLHRLAPEAKLEGIEAQDVSIALARRSVAHNGLADRVSYHDGDIRDPGVLQEGRRFELITGSPPYFPLGTCVVSPHPQRAACRVELRGSVMAYAEAAQRWLAPGGGFCFVMASGDERAERAPEEHGFTVLSRIDYLFREGRPPTVSTFFCRRTSEGPFPDRRHETVVVRDRHGEWTPEYLAIRSAVGPS
ncbi:MAG: methyltransferase domain-containing protein [Proteobacteria bacterium]|nr:methyltransferase domain-containing protein [Pseudomonadota bacterium]